jgi:hypothetical protein
MPTAKTQRTLWFLALYLGGLLTLTAVAGLLKVLISML